MKIPKRIVVNGHEFTVSLIVGDTRFASAGDVCNWTKTIRINTADEAAESTQAEALLHELIEIIDHDNELKLSHNTICTLGEQLFGIIRNNNLDFITKE